MITEKELRKILKKTVAGNVSRWARENGLFSQRGNISEMLAGKKGISKVVAKKLGYMPNIKCWILKK